MTAQAADSVLFRGERFLICGANGPDLVVPSDFGLKPEMPSTACYRGWMAEYAIADRIELADLYVFHDAGLPVKNRRPNGPIINGVSPQEPSGYGSTLGFNCLYKRLNLPLTFSGGILLGRGFVRDALVNMGFHAFWKFEEVHELTFEQGALMGAVEKSQVAKTVREKHLVKNVLGRPDLSKDAEVKEWIERCLSLRYDI